MKHLTFGAALLAASVIASPGWAADLGGNCCADLEERVAELEATTARKGNRKVSLQVYGHVNEAVLFWDGIDGRLTDARVIPAVQSQTRFGFRGTAKINAQWSAGYLLEIGVGGFDEDGQISRDLAVRHSALYVTAKSVGTIWLGHTSMASDGLAEVDLSRSQTALLSLSLTPFDASIGAPGTFALDGYRANLVKYVSPAVAGFSLSAAWSSEDVYDVALRYAGEFGAIRVAGAIGWRHDMGPTSFYGPDGRKTETIVGSASVMHTPSGLFLGGAWGKQDVAAAGLLPAVEGTGWEIRGGVALKAGAGATLTPFVRYMEAQVDGGQIGTGIGGGLVYSWGPFDLYAAYQHVEIDATSETVQAGLVGAKIRF